MSEDLFTQDELQTHIDDLEAGLRQVLENEPVPSWAVVSAAEIVASQIRVAVAVFEKLNNNREEADAA